jgi:methionine-R-sulfoxide reductase
MAIQKVIRNRQLGQAEGENELILPLLPAIMQNPFRRSSSPNLRFPVIFTPFEAVMKLQHSILLGFALLFAFGVSTTIRAIDPPESSNGSDGSKRETAKEDAKTKKSTTLSKSKKMSDPFNKLTKEEADVIIRKGTEAREKGYTHSKVVGTYICKRCNAPLYNSTGKFESDCGWPAFDDEIKGSVKRQLERDGTGRIEIVCQNCDGHLGHVFLGEQLTEKNTRHCVNSISIKLIPKGKELPKMIKADAEEEAPATPIKSPKESVPAKTPGK